MSFLSKRKTSSSSSLLESQKKEKPNKEKYPFSRSRDKHGRLVIKGFDPSVKHQNTFFDKRVGRFYTPYKHKFSSDDSSPELVKWFFPEDKRLPPLVKLGYSSKRKTESLKKNKSGLKYLDKYQHRPPISKKEYSKNYQIYHEKAFPLGFFSDSQRYTSLFSNEEMAKIWDFDQKIKKADTRSELLPILSPLQDPEGPMGDIVHKVSALTGVPLYDGICEVLGSVISHGVKPTFAEIMSRAVMVYGVNAVSFQNRSKRELADLYYNNSFFKDMPKTQHGKFLNDPESVPYHNYVLNPVEKKSGHEVVKKRNEDVFFDPNVDVPVSENFLKKEYSDLPRHESTEFGRVVPYSLKKNYYTDPDKLMDNPSNQYGIGLYYS